MKRRKLRDLGISIGILPVGAKNCLTDVPGVHVGHKTLHYPLENNEYASTGVTAILPHGDNLFRYKVAAAAHVINGYGKTTRLVQLDELGRLESPIMLTNTFGVPAVTQGTLEYLLEQNPDIGNTIGTVNVVVGECNDSYLNSIRKFLVEPNHAKQAINNATTDQAKEGAVGAGMGMVCCDYKGGIGTSSRLISSSKMNRTYTIGCLVLSNFGQEKDLLRNQIFSKQAKLNEKKSSKESDGSIMIILATNAPLNERQLKRLAKRAGIGLGKSGSQIAHGSGDVVIAFSTAQTFSTQTSNHEETLIQLREDHPIMNELFRGVAEVTEEAILNSLTQARTTVGRQGRVVEALDYHLIKS